MGRWRDAPRAVRLTVGAVLLVFSWGSVVHVAQALGVGGPTVPLPGWLAAFFAALLVLDPLVVVLLWLRLRAGVALATTVLAADAVANGWANHVLDPSAGVTAGRVGHGVITVLALALLAVAPMLWRWSGRRQDDETGRFGWRSWRRPTSSGRARRGTTR